MDLRSQAASHNELTYDLDLALYSEGNMGLRSQADPHDLSVESCSVTTIPAAILDEVSAFSSSHAPGSALYPEGNMGLRSQTDSVASQSSHDKQLISLCDCIQPVPCPSNTMVVQLGPLGYVRNMLFSLALPPVLGFDLVVKWHNATISAMDGLMVWDGYFASGFSFFTDGSSVVDEDGIRHSAAAVFLLVHSPWGTFTGGFRAWRIPSRLSMQPLLELCFGPFSC